MKRSNWVKSSFVKFKALALVVIVFVVLGIVLLILSHASTPTIIIEPESPNNTRSGGATIVSDPNASGGKYVKFGPAAGVRIAAAGDLACDDSICASDRVSQLAVNYAPDAFFALGDIAYHFGSQADYDVAYTPTWGRPSLLAVTHPVIGDHEYYYTGTYPPGTPCRSHGFPCIYGKTTTDTARPYWHYFANQIPVSARGNDTDPSSRKGYYSFNLGSWHVVVLSTNCTNPSPTSNQANGGSDTSTQKVPGGCGDTSPQLAWLNNDLTTYNQQNPGNRCTLAVFHNPFTKVYKGSATASGTGLNNNGVWLPIWKVLYDKGVDVTMSGNTHDYQHFPNLSRSGLATDVVTSGVNHGIEEFVVGTGGEGLSPMYAPFPSIMSKHASAQADRGIMTATLRQNSFDYQYKPLAGSTFNDSGSVTCH